MKNVMVVIKPEQYQWIKSHHINFSSFVRAQIEIYRKNDVMNDETRNICIK